MKINILGSEWDITFRKAEDDVRLSNFSGYTDHTTRSIIVEEFEDHPQNVSDLSQLSKKILRHEIVHAFMYESGLAGNSNDTDAWAMNEEMVDWIAFQGLKLYKAWQDADAI